ncbi:hypothetical protein V6N11_007608 [Hibiscus sabdariffa]|uniref:Uncharacterized protein n=1 Tax=Hibiscus sabdariffa TaxID=183260 RepID=A0ABR2NIX1_9ROSI
MRLYLSTPSVVFHVLDWSYSVSLLCWAAMFLGMIVPKALMPLEPKNLQRRWRYELSEEHTVELEYVDCLHRHALIHGQLSCHWISFYSRIKLLRLLLLRVEDKYFVMQKVYCRIFYKKNGWPLESKQSFHLSSHLSYFPLSNRFKSLKLNPRPCLRDTKLLTLKIKQASLFPFCRNATKWQGMAHMTGCMQQFCSDKKEIRQQSRREMIQGISHLIMPRAIARCTNVESLPPAPFTLMG